jgi:hypothetical protein
MANGSQRGAESTYRRRSSTRRDRSTDGRRVVMTTEETLAVCDTTSGRSKTVFSARPDGLLGGFALSADEKWIYYVRESVESDVWMATLR